MSYRDKTPAFDSFAELLAAHARGELRRERLRLVSWSSSCAVTIEEDGDPIFDADGDEVDREEGRLLLRCDAPDLFAIEVIEALGGKGMLA